MYDFNRLANRKEDNTRKWDKTLIEKKYELGSEDYIPMWIADMDFESPDFIVAGFNKIIENRSFSYTHVYESFYEAVTKWYAEKKNVAIEHDWLTLTYGTVSTLHYVVQTYTKLGDSVIINTPVYDPFRYSVENNGRKVITNPLKINDNRYFIDFDLLEQQLKSSKVKLMIFCNPHNPSGRVWDKGELLKIAQLCLENNVILVSDEVHSDVIHQGTFISQLSFEKKYKDNLIVLSSANKSFNLGGLKTSYSIIPNEELRSKFKTILLENAITSPNIFGIEGIIASYTCGEEWLNQSQEYLLSNYHVIKTFILENELDVEYMEMESSYLLWMDISKKGLTSEEFVSQLAKQTSLIVEPGTNFSRDGEGFIRINIGTSQEIVIQAMHRLKSFLQE